MRLRPPPLARHNFVHTAVPSSFISKSFVDGFALFIVIYPVCIAYLSLRLLLCVLHLANDIQKASLAAFFSNVSYLHGSSP
jgi:hypothetical protein